MNIIFLRKNIAAIAIATSVLSACVSAPKLAEPAQLLTIAPTPIQGNHGEYMSPYTTDDVLAEWVDKAINAKMGSAVGSAIGQQAGQQLLENIPFIGGILGEQMGSAAGRAIAIKASGGMEFIKETSDLSFSNVEDLSVFMYANYGTTEHFQSALEATWEIYPELQEKYHYAIAQASESFVQ